MKQKYYWGLLILVSAFGLIQFTTPVKITSAPAKDLSSVPEEVNNILRSSCYDCHSSEVNLSWYDKFTPANFIISSHIQAGREAFNFSDFDSLTKAKQNATLYYALNKVLSGEMPLPSYTVVHPGAKLNNEEIKVLKDYISSRTPRRITESMQIANPNVAFIKNIKPPASSKTKPAPNGIDYIDHWRKWTAISTTDRFDNGSLRIIYGNDIAVRAIQAKQINPFPDGAILAKAAWQQQMGQDSIVVPGKFIQVEFMIKEAKKYASTAGWGWARWKGDDLKPYGKTATFTTECISCHNPVKDNDNVFTTPLNLNDFLNTK